MAATGEKVPLPMWTPPPPIWKTRWWFGYQGKPYDKQKAWWAEMGYKDAAIENGRMPLSWPPLKEYDPYYYDPPVKDGESQLGRGGLDHVYKPNLISGADWPPDRVGEMASDRSKWREFLRESDPVVKGIRAKYDISPEHPGLSFRADIDKPKTSCLWKADNAWWHGGLGLSRRGPCFFDTPMGYDCHMKAIAAAKMGFFGMIPIAAWYMQTHMVLATEALPYSPMKDRLALIGRRFVNLTKWPVAHAFVWGGAVCYLAQIRQKDDFLNPVFAATFTGLLQYTRSGVAGRSFQLIFPVAFLGWLWHFARCQGQGLAPNQHITGQWYSSPDNRWTTKVFGYARFPENVT